MTMQEFYQAGIAHSNRTEKSLSDIAAAWDNPPFKTLRIGGRVYPLYFHRTDGGAEYLSNAHLPGSDEGTLKGATVIVRIDGREIEILRLPAQGV